MERNYVILNISEVTQDIIDVCLETSLDTLRKTKDNSKTIVKFEGDVPSLLEGKKLYTHYEIKQELQKNEWILNGT